MSRMRCCGPRAPHLLLEALRESLSNETHPGHVELVGLLEVELERPQAVREEKHEGTPDPGTVRYLKLLNRLIDGLQKDPDALRRCMMGLSVLGARPPADVRDFPMLFDHLTREKGCGPNNLTLLEAMLESLDRTDLLQLVQQFKAHGNSTSSSSSSSSPVTIITHHSRTVQSLEAMSSHLASILSLSLTTPEVTDNGYTLSWTAPPSTSLAELQSRLSGKEGELRTLDVQRLLLDTASGRYQLLGPPQDNQVRATSITWGSWPCVDRPMDGFLAL